MCNSPQYVQPLYLSLVLLFCIVGNVVVESGRDFSDHKASIHIVLQALLKVNQHSQTFAVLMCIHCTSGNGFNVSVCFELNVARIFSYEVHFEKCASLYNICEQMKVVIWL